VPTERLSCFFAYCIGKCKIEELNAIGIERVTFSSINIEINLIYVIFGLSHLYTLRLFYLLFIKLFLKCRNFGA